MAFGDSKYSDIFKAIILNLVSVSPSDRLTLEELWNFIQPFHEPILRKEQFMIPSAPQKVEMSLASYKNRMYWSSHLLTHNSLTQLFILSKYQPADLAILETWGSSFVVPSIHVFQYSVMWNHKNFGSFNLLRYLFHSFHSLHSPLKASLTAFKRSGKNLLKYFQISSSIFLL